MSLEVFAEDVWTVTRPQRFLGVECGTRMTVVRLASGDLFVHSPVPLDDALAAELQALGEVRVILAPSLFHHLSVPQWAAAYPKALLTCCPGLVRKRPDVHFHRALGDAPEPEWEQDLEQVHFSARTMESEIVLFHGKSRTLICADAIFNFSTHASRLTRVVARLLGNTTPGVTWLEPLMMRDKPKARAQLDRMLAWDPVRLAIAHGEPVRSEGKRVLAEAYAWIR